MEPKETGVNAEVTNSGHNAVDVSNIPLINQVLLKGIPVANKEDLQSIFMRIAKEIDYDTTNPLSIPQLHRQLTVRMPARESSTIIMYFADHDFKTKFYNQFFEKYPLKKEFLNTMKTNIIILGENLTKENASILTKCRKYKRDNKIATTYSNDGIVYIKFKKGNNEKAYAVKSKEELDSIIKSNGQNMDEAGDVTAANVNESNH